MNRVLLIHQSLPQEAEVARRSICEVLGVPVVIEEQDTDRFLDEVHGAACAGHSCNRAWEVLAKERANETVLVLTSHDIMDAARWDDPEAWYFGGTHLTQPHSVLSVARLRTGDGRPASPPADPERYASRVAVMAVHEVGHVAFRDAPHYFPAYCVVASRRDDPDSLGTHCDDNTCVMYEVIDIPTPPPDDSYLELRGHASPIRTDAGLDDHIARMGAPRICSRCAGMLASARF
jgi:predicted Zn-dependent protease